MQDVFFQLSRSKAKKVIQEAMAISKSISVDELDCSKSYARQPTLKTSDEIFDMALKDKVSFWYFAIRYSLNDKNKPLKTDIGLSTGSAVVYFLWIDIDVKEAYKIAEKYKLKLLR